VPEDVVDVADAEAVAEPDAVAVDKLVAGALAIEVVLNVKLAVGDGDGELLAVSDGERLCERLLVGETVGEAVGKTDGETVGDTVGEAEAAAPGRLAPVRASAICACVSAKP